MGEAVPVDKASAFEPGSPRWWAERAATAGRRRPRAGGLSTERIVHAALEILNEGGIDALTVRAVAERLHTANASLYRHIASRDELITLIADHVLGEIDLSRTGRGWRADVEALMREMRRVALAQPLPPSVGRRRSGYGPNMLRLVDAGLSLFLEAGLDEQQAAYSTTTMIQFVGGTVDIERSAAGRGPQGAVGAAGYSQLLDGLPADSFHSLRRAGAAYVAAPADDVFAYGMARFLDGVASQLARTRDGRGECGADRLAAHSPDVRGVGGVGMGE